MLFACVFIPEFPLRAITRHEPALRSAAVAIVEGTPPSCFVIAANPKARQMGVAEGMTKLEAAQVPSLEIRRRSLAEEESAHRALLDLGWSLSPRVEETAADTLVLDLEGLNQLFGPPEKIARRLARGAASLGLDSQIAVASNIEAAVHAARGFPSITIIPKGKEAESLAKLHVDLLASDCLESVLQGDARFAAKASARARASLEAIAEILVTLDRWGVRTFGDLAVLPTPDLSERLGQEGIRLQRWARGQGARTLVPAEPTQHFEEAIEFEDSIEMLDPLMFILGRMLDSLCARLRARSMATNEMRLRLWLEESSDTSVKSVVSCQSSAVSCDRDLAGGLGKGPRTKDQGPTSEPQIANPESRILTLPVPTLNKKTLLKLWLLNLQSDPPRAPILKLKIEAVATKPRAAQGGLFQPLAPDPEKLEITLARIAGVVGKGKVGSPEIVDTHRPGAFRMRRFVAQEARHDDRKSNRLRKNVSTSCHSEPVRSSAANGPECSEGAQGRLREESRSVNKTVRDSSLASSGPPAASQNDIVRGGFQKLTKQQRSSIENRQSPISNPRMALRVFRPPRPAMVDTRDDVPVRVYAGEIHGEVVACGGPWRTSGEWWGDAWEQDEWDVEISNSRVVNRQLSVVGNNSRLTRDSGRRTPDTVEEASVLYRLYRDIASGRWFVRGIYD